MIDDSLSIYTKHNDRVNCVHMREVSKVEFWRERVNEPGHYRAMYGIPSPEGYGGWRYFRVN